MLVADAIVGTLLTILVIVVIAVVILAFIRRL